MPSVDMPLNELRQYQGTNPCPQDYDAYWARAVSELDAVEHKMELLPADFHCGYADCYHMRFTGVGGAQIHANYLRPKNTTQPHPALLMFHGYGGSAGDFSEKLAYVAAGFSVAVMDARGQGGLSQDIGGTIGNTQQGHIIRGLDDPNPDKLLFRNVFLDTLLLAKIVMDLPEVDRSRVGVSGNSQGGALALVCAALCPSIKRAVVAYPFLSDYKRVWEMDLAQDAFVELRQYFRSFDPFHLRETEIFTKLGYIDIQNLASRIQADTLFFTGLMDTWCPPSIQFAVYNKITSHKSICIYPDFGHENMPQRNDKTFEFLMQL